LFDPFLRDEHATYLAVSDIRNSINGSAVIIYFGEEKPQISQPNEISFLETLRGVLYWTFELQPKEIKTIKLRYGTGFIRDSSQATMNPYSLLKSKEYLLFMEQNALIQHTTTNNKP